MRSVHFMSRNYHLSPSARGGDIPTPLPGRAATHIDARIAAMRAGGMSARAIRRALGLSEAAATAAGILTSGRLAAAPAPDGAATGAREASGPGGPGGPSGFGEPRMDAVLDAVARGSGIDRKILVAAGQRRPAVRARHLVMYQLASPNIRFSTSNLGFQIDRIGPQLAP